MISNMQLRIYKHHFIDDFNYSFCLFVYLEDADIQEKDFEKKSAF